jgi:tRNA-splicing endonuclease subunit Sen34
MNDSDANQGPIKVYSQKDKFFVWDPSDVLRLRKKHHIIGSLVGSIADNFTQNQLQGLPMLLNHYETAVLVKNGFCIIYDGNTPYPVPTADVVTKFNEEREADFQKQDEDARIKKQLGELQYKNIKNVKRPKNKKEDMIDSQEIKPDSATNDSNNENTVNTNENNTNVNNTSENNPKNNQQSKKSKNKPVERQHGVVTTFIEDYWIKRDIKTANTSIILEGIYKDQKYLVFEDLWRRGFYVTGGSKFGGDFLAYPGDPFRYHAHYIIRVTDWNDQLSPLDLVAFGRLAMSVNKSPVIASVDPNSNHVTFNTLQWEGK